MNFVIDTSTFFDISVLRLDKLQHRMFSPKISTPMDDVNVKRPGDSEFKSCSELQLDLYQVVSGSTLRRDQRAQIKT